MTDVDDNRSMWTKLYGIRDIKNTKRLTTKMLQLPAIVVSWFGRLLIAAGEKYRKVTIQLYWKYYSWLTRKLLILGVSPMLENCGEAIINACWAYCLRIKANSVVQWNLSMMLGRNDVQANEFTPQLKKGGCEVQTGVFKRSDCNKEE